MPNWTKEQSEAIFDRSGNLLVSAAAGSGKTAVMIERIFSLIASGKPEYSLDKAVIVTYTNAAAASMRQKLADRINKALADNPGNAVLLKQRSLIDRADISTIHSYCIKLLRRYYFATPLTPDFKILTKTEVNEASEGALNEVIENASEAYLKNDFPEYGALYDALVESDSDKSLPESIMSLASVLDMTVDRAAFKNAVLSGNNGCAEYLMSYIKLLLASFDKQLSEAKADYCANEKLVNYIIDLSDKVRPISNAKTLEAMVACIPAQLTSIPTGTDDAIKTRIAQIKATYQKAKDIMRGIDFNATENIEALNALFTITEQYMAKRDEALLEKGGIDISSPIHFAYALLTEHPDIAADIKDDITCIYVDEYQDTNFMQDTLVAMLSNGSNLFLVGDVKQSIYLFQNARPDLFIQKLHTYNGALGKCIFLKNNFRSVPAVLAGINFVFENVMSERLNEIDYDGNAALYPSPDGDYIMNKAGFVFDGKAEAANELLLTPCGKDKNNSPYTGIIDAEAEAIALRIKKLMQSEFVDSDGTKRPVRYKDIAILGRKNSFGAILEPVLKKYGIPYLYDTMPDKRFDATVVLTSLLKLLLIKQQDIELLSVLTSCIGGFTYSELARVREEKSDLSFYTALKECTDKTVRAKADAFFARLKKYRLLQKTMPLADFVEFIYTDSGYIYDVAYMEDGAKQLEAVNRYILTARRYESNSDGGLSGFIKYIERYNKDAAKNPNEEKEVFDGNIDAVRFTTMHKSKGLEYPIVILAYAGRDFRSDRSEKKLIWDSALGASIKGIKKDKKNEPQSVTQSAIAQKKKNAEEAEYLRLLYVAMTRAQYKLIISAACYTNKHSNEILFRENDAVPLLYKSYAELIIPLLYRHSECNARLAEVFGFAPVDFLPTSSDWSVNVTTAADLKYSLVREGATSAAPVELAPEKENTLPEINTDIFSWQYPYALATAQRTKYNPSKGNTHTRPLLRKPAFEDKEFDGAQKGTVVHFFMEHAVFDGTPARIQAENMLSRGIITKEEFDCLPFKQIDGFLSSDMARRMAQADTLCRERSFCKIVPLNSFGDEALIQGIIDCYFFEKDSIILLDYKTDIIRDGLDEHILRHTPQLLMYKASLEALYPGKTVTPYLHFFSIDKTVEVKNPAVFT